MSKAPVPLIHTYLSDTRLVDSPFHTHAEVLRARCSQVWVGGWWVDGMCIRLGETLVPFVYIDLSDTFLTSPSTLTRVHWIVFLVKPEGMGRGC